MTNFGSLEHARRQALKLTLVRSIVDASIEQDIAERRSESPLRRRFLDETMVTASPLAIAAATGGAA